MNSNLVTNIVGFHARQNIMCVFLLFWYVCQRVGVFCKSSGYVRLAQEAHRPHSPVGWFPYPETPFNGSLGVFGGVAWQPDVLCNMVG
jgi:hypothetical protein